MASISEMYVSELLGNPVIDPTGERVGKVTDIGINDVQPYPAVTFLAIRRGKETYYLDFRFVNLANRQIFAVSKKVKNLPLEKTEPRVVWLKENILDKQIFDMMGSKVVRVNDIKLAYLEGVVRAVAVDISFLGILRRLRLAGFFSRLAALFDKKLREELIAWEYIKSIHKDTAGLQLSVTQESLKDLHPSDLAEILSQLNYRDSGNLLRALDDEMVAEALGEMDADFSAALLENLDDERVSEILDEMSADDITDFLKDLPEYRRARFLALLDREDKEEVEDLLKYDDETAGGLMTTEMITLREEMTAQETIEHLRQVAPEAETIYYLYVVNNEEKLVGVVSLRDLIVAPPDTPIRDIMHRKVIRVTDDMNAARVADVIAKYNLLAVPVVDAEGHLLGIITVDDIIDTLYKHQRRH